MHWQGQIYSSGTLTSDDFSSWDLWPVRPVLRSRVVAVSANMTGDETLDVVLYGAYDSSGTGSHTLKAYDQHTADQTKNWSANQGTELPLPDYWRVGWTLGGTSPSLSFVVNAVLVSG